MGRACNHPDAHLGRRQWPGADETELAAPQLFYQLSYHPRGEQVVASSLVWWLSLQARHNLAGPAPPLQQTDVA